MRAPATLTAVTMLLAALAWACSSTSGGAVLACPNDLPQACPTPPPSYQGKVLGIISAKCQTCHGVGGIEQSYRDLSTYDDIQASTSSMLDQVYQCQMPPPDAGQLSSDERAALLAWLVCGAPNN
jgi:uncharacterized membrane protein